MLTSIKQLVPSDAAPTIQVFWLCIYFAEQILRCCENKSVLGWDSVSLGGQSLAFLKNLREFLTLKMKVIWSFKTLQTTHRMTKHHNPEHYNLTQYQKKGQWTDINMSWGSVLGILTTLWAGQPRNRHSIPSHVQKFISPSKHPDRFSGPNQPPTSSVPGFFSQR
jgi:hypothetical protein